MVNPALWRRSLRTAAIARRALTAGRYFIGVGYPNAGFWDKALAATGPLLITLDAGSPPVRRDIEVVRGGWLGVCIEAELEPKSHAILGVLDASGRLARELDLIGGCSGATLALPEGTYRVRAFSRRDRDRLGRGRPSWMGLRRG